MAKLSDRLILFKYMLSLFGETSIETLCNGMKDEKWEGLDENNITKFFYFITGKYAGLFSFPAAKLQLYDNNIVSHTLKMQKKRDRFRWKYFQYMALLFTEIYLDKYFSDPEKLKNDLNKYLEQFMRDNKIEDEEIKPYTLEDLNKIAIWQATGSGKTLLMHVNIMQYRYYLNKYGKEKGLNRTLLLTPNEGLSTQHKKEFELSGMNADLFSKDSSSLFASNDIEIIDIHKLEDVEGGKTVSVDSFENNNFVLVDEGHRGATGEDWMEKRKKLCEKGFSIEYSATFGQAITASNEDMFQEYAKCILFDYSYKYFYEDGYGKEYAILNLPNADDADHKRLYMTACLLTFYQQLKLYNDNKAQLTPYYIEEPLLVFVGSKVNAVRTERGAQISDVVDILLFLSAFVSNKSVSVEDIRSIINRGGILLDAGRNDLFANKFDYLSGLGMRPEKLYEEIRKDLFNCTQSGATLHLDNLKGVQGEIGVRVGDNDYFGVINVGDDSKLLGLCEDNGFSVFSKDFSSSLFRDIESPTSKIKVLIGSKKFTEGWNSWRVSTMGLMNVGRSEGSEIIQLFGRGVRLRGHDGCLKRSAFVD
ncbi:MAG: DEAD/DEAH box helicase family protein, partial [Eubacteriales bacterium]|nr:DEAD/DEAH box helicase family protein [Eubacteriales bacterium]